MSRKIRRHITFKIITHYNFYDNFYICKYNRTLLTPTIFYMKKKMIVLYKKNMIVLYKKPFCLSP